jgi:hypothetical protein
MIIDCHSLDTYRGMILQLSLLCTGGLPKARHGIGKQSAALPRLAPPDLAADVRWWL